MELSHVESVFAAYYGFDDGVVKAFDFRFTEEGACSVRLELYACNYELGRDVWRRVSVVVGGVHEVRSAGIPAVIHSKIKVLEVAGGYCLEVNGDYGEVPMSLEAIRKYSDCYVLGSSIDVSETE